MPTFAVMLHGTGCWIEAEERRWGFLNRRRVKPMGFYTTRFVNAASESEAAFKAVALVEAEVKELHRKETPFTITVEKIGETANQPDSGKGFSWYLEEHVS